MRISDWSSDVCSSDLVRADAGVTSFADLAGKTFIAGGKGSFGERRTRDVFDALGIGDKVSFVDVEMNAAVPALKNGQVAGFATAGSFPAPYVTEAAAGPAIRLLGLDRMSTRLNSSHYCAPRMPPSA